MTPGEMLALLDESLARARSKRIRRNGPCVTLRGKATVLGQEGAWIGEDNLGAVYVFSVRQCQRMREVILDAAREDARAAGLPV